MNITVVGIGYVGLSLAILLSQHNHVMAVDILEDKVAMINKWKSPIRDEYVKKYLHEHEERGLDLSATTNDFDAYKNADYVIISTPTNYDPYLNHFDCSTVESVINRALKASSTSTLVIKSTVPVGYTEMMREKFETDRILFSPEFLRESKSLYDNLYPSRIVVGTSESKREQAENFARLLMEGAAKEKIDALIMGGYGS